MGQQTFEVEGRVLGSRTIPNFTDIPGFGKRAHHSYAYFCPKCGGIWGRLLHWEAPYTQCIYRECQEHGDGRLSLSNPAGAPLEIGADWPREALWREFLLELDGAER